MDFPEAGAQVPKGTVKPGEAMDFAANRSARGAGIVASLDGLTHIGTLTQTALGEPEEWNFFAMSVDGNLPDTWKHRVSGKGEDEGMRFRYYWLPLFPEPELADGQGDGLSFLHAHLQKVND